ncbi:MAG TPA: acyltransferase [Mycobacteriales bacterium]|nr:acyltransferase [Mycobacteriales bacterium]
MPGLRDDIERRRREARFWAAYSRQHAMARWHLRHCTSVGIQATVLGTPTVDATDMIVGDHFKIWSGHRKTLVTGWGRIRIGDRVFINSGTVLFSVVAVVIGNDVAIANEAYLMDSDSHGVEGRPVKEAPIHIGDGSWIGARAMILPGVTIGSRCLVAAGAVVSRDIPDDTLVAGNPARVIRELVYPDGVTRAWHD